MNKEQILDIQNKRDEYTKLSEKSYQDYDDCDKAIEYMKEAIHISKELPFEDNDFLAQAMYYLGLFYEDNQEIETSKANYIEAIRLYEKTSNVYDVRYLKSLGAVANFFAHDCLYQNATQIFTKAISLIETLPKKNREINELELNFLTNYASCYEIINREQETIANCNTAIRFLTGKVDKRTLKKVKLHLFLGEFYFLSKGDYAQAAHNFEKALFFGEDIFKQNPENCAIVNYYIAKTNYLANIYNKAIEYFTYAKEEFIALKDERAVICAVNIALMNIILNKDQNVEEDINKIKSFIETNYGAKSVTMMKQIYEKLAQVYFDKGNIEKANEYIGK